MSKDILVNKGDTLTVIRDISKLVTNLSNGGMATWIPEDETLLVTKTIIKDGTYEASREATKPYGYSQVTVTGVGNKIMGDLGEKSITKNGVYIAKQDKDGPFYGYSKLYVNVPGGNDGSGGGSSPTITGKDGDGDDAIVGTDEDGKIVTSKLPDTIQVVTPPTITVYEDGQTIDFHGIEVKAYLPDGTEWGTVDNLELSFPEPIAEYDQSGTDRSMYHKLPIPYHTFDYSGRISRTKRVYSFDTNNIDYYIFRAPPGDVTDVQIYFVFDCTNRNVRVISKDYYPENSSYAIYTQTHAPDAYMYVGTTKWGYNSHGPWYEYNPIVSYDVPLYNGDINDFFYCCIQTIPVQWHRPGDGKSLYDNFEITVNQRDDSGGQDPEPAPTPSPD